MLIKSKTSSKKIDDASSHDHMIIYHVQSFTEVLKELQIFATKKKHKTEVNLLYLKSIKLLKAKHKYLKKE